MLWAAQGPFLNPQLAGKFSLRVCNDVALSPKLKKVTVFTLWDLLVLVLVEILFKS